MYTLRNNTIKQRCLSEIGNLLACDPPQYDVVIKKHKKDKTRAQRSYFHKVVQLVCEHTGDDPEYVKLQFKYRVLPLVQVEVDGETHLTPISSEKATREQYSQLIECAKIYAAAAGVSIPNPEFYGQ